MTTEQSAGMTTDVTLYELATEAFEETGNIKDAEARVVALLKADSDLYARVIDDVLKVAIYNAVQKVIRRVRKGVRDGNVSSRPSSRVIMGTILEAQASLMDYPLSTGIRLGDATKPDIMRDVEARTKPVRTLRIELAWLNGIASELQSLTAKVREQLNESDLARLKNDAERLVEGFLAPRRERVSA